MTASKAYQFIAYLNNKQANWEQKINKFLNENFKGNSNTNHGVRCEPKAREKYAEDTKCVIKPSGLLVHPQIPWLGYSPDGLVLNSHIIEIKCPVEGKKMSAKDVALSTTWIETEKDKEGIVRKFSLKKIILTIAKFN